MYVYARLQNLICNFFFWMAIIEFYTNSNVFDLQWYGSNESVYVEFPNKAKIDKRGLHSAWTIAFNIPKTTQNLDSSSAH